MSEDRRAQEAVIEAVRQGESRLRRHALIIELSRAAIAAAAVPALVAAFRVLRPVPTALVIASFVIPAVALAAWAVFRIGRHAAAERTASRMDRDAALKDELVSAHWFASHGPETDWTHAQIDRAAARVNAIDWDAAQPAPRPNKAWATAAVLLGVTVILLFVPTGSIGGSARLDAAASAAAKKSAAVEMLETRIDETEMSDADRMRAKDILAALEKGGLSSEEAKKLLAELEALLGKDGLDKATLEAMAKALDASPSAKDLAEALRNRDMAKAAEEARKLAEKAQSLSKQERDALAKAMEKAANEPKDKSLEKLADDLRDAAEKLKGDDTEEMKKSLEKMADSMDEMAKEAQEKGAEAAEATDSMEEAMGEEGQASDQGEKAGESKKQSSQSTGNMQGEGEGMAREAASMPNPSQSQMPGLGQMSGQPQGQPPQKPAELKEGQRRIEVALKEELVRAHDEAGNDKPEELVDRKTERVDSTVQYRRVEGAPDYDRTKAQQEGTIPEARRAVVKKYFSALGPRGGGKQ